MTTPLTRALALLAPLLSAAAAADVTPPATMLRYPDISAERICFVYANDIWVAPRMGGVAAPLASPPGAESFPRFSPDGSRIAFVGNYEGNRDLYTIAVHGGIPSRVTHHPSAETLCDWTPDGARLLYLTNGFAGLARQTQMFAVPAAGGMPQKLAMPYAGFGAMSADGQWIAFTPHSTDTRTWKRYRGGMATDIWLLNPATAESRRITDWEGTDTLPMWGHGPKAGVVFYSSDAGPEHRLNIWSYDIATGARAQITTFTDDDVKWPSMGPGPGPSKIPGQLNEATAGEIIFQLGPTLRVLDVSTGRVRDVSVTIPGDRPRIAAQDVDAARNLQGSALSPTAKRVLVVGRGDIWSLPAKEGVVRNLTRTDNVFEREPAWSPDGRWIAYFSDQTGEYELWLRPSGARPPEPDDKDKDKDKDKDGKDGDAEKDAAEDADADKPDAPAADKPAVIEPTRLSNLGAGFRFGLVWSPDSKHVAFVDKAGKLFIATLTIEGASASAAVKEIDDDPHGIPGSLSWAGDSNWLAYTRADDVNGFLGVVLYNVKDDKKTRVTDPMTAVSAVAFDRKGDWLFMTSSRNWAPTYADLDTTFIYSGTEVLLMAALRENVRSPFAPKSDEEQIRTDDKKPDPKKDAKNGADKKDKPDAKPDDGLTGSWEGRATGPNLPPDGLPFSMRLRVADGAVSGTISSAMGSGTGSGTLDKDGAFTFSFTVNNAQVTFEGTIKDGQAKGSWHVGDDRGDWTAKRVSRDAPADDKDAPAPGAKDKKKPVKIDLEGLERRAIPLPVPPGNFRALAGTDDGKLIYVRTSARGSGGGEPGIKIFDPKDEAREEKAVTSGGNFEMSADGKKLLVGRGGSMVIVDAAAGGGKSQSVSTAGMRARIRPREEWKQIFLDAWRLQRDYFYEPTLHGVNWPAMRDHYGAMIDDCTSREDVAYVIAELISELNIGHAYVTGAGDVESDPPGVSVGMLGCDFALENGAFRITRIYEGGPWDSDARGPLSQLAAPGDKKGTVAAGDYLLAVNGVPPDTSRDVYAALVGLAGRVTTLTVSASPVADGSEREVLVQPIGSEGNVRYRAWIEAKRQYVFEKSGGKVGYIYVPNTGVNGQSDLFRQFYGQHDRAALIIDERWNGGGQIPTRFIELLNRPVTNYWARRDSAPDRWPPDSHQGPKCMLINGLAGSGGDMFPWLFRQSKLGKLIGTRTWGGLVGISGNPGLIDGGAISVPTFGFFKKDGTWGVEGHGVDPDMEIIDDPARMLSPHAVPGKGPAGDWLGGGDPQLDAAIALMLAEIQTSGYTPPSQPASPDRSGMGIPERDR